MRVSLKAVAGVDFVDVSLEKGLASVRMKPGNKATFAQLQKAITKNGFTMKQSKATVAGGIVSANGKIQLRVSGSDDVLNLVPESQAHVVPLIAGKSVIVTGTIPEAQKGKSPDAIVYTTVSEEATP